LVMASLRSAPAVSFGCAPRYQLQRHRLVPYLAAEAHGRWRGRFSRAGDQRE
jgi:hypothetical protein